MAFSDTGDFNKTGLPLTPPVFAAYNLLIHNADQLAKRATPEFSLGAAQALLRHGVKDDTALAATLLCMMPAELDGLVARRLGKEVADMVNALRLHGETAYAYLEDASADVQKISLVILTQSLGRLENTAQTLLERLADPETAMAVATGQATLHLPLMPSPKLYLRVADVTQGTTGHAGIEVAYSNAALAYQTFRQDYAMQLLMSGLMPAEVHPRLNAMLAEAPALPEFEATGIFNTPELAAVYDFITKDGRVALPNLGAAIDIGEILTNGDASADIIGAAMLATALPALKDSERVFLQERFSRDIVDLCYESQSPFNPAYVTPERAQMVLANCCVQLNGALAIAGSIEQRLPRVSEASRLPFFMQNASQLMPAIYGAQETLETLAGIADGGILENMVKTRIDGLQGKIDAIGKSVGFNKDAQTPRAPASKTGPGL